MKELATKLVNKNLTKKIEKLNNYCYKKNRGDIMTNELIEIKDINAEESKVEANKLR